MGEATKVVPPNTARIVEGLRDTGYTFEAAIADLVDNSIEAGATAVGIRVSSSAGGEVLVHIADNGVGMDLAGLENAMRYGADAKPSANRLGKFGLGLKTASTSFCRRLSVISRRSGDDSDLFAATWDIDSIIDAGEWVLELGGASATERDAFGDAIDDLEACTGAPVDSGTLVQWDKVDRLLRRNAHDYADLDAAIQRRTTGLRRHLSMVFHQFLDPGDKRATDVDIYLNGTKVEPWDPFCEAYGIAPEKVAEFTFSDESGKPVGKIALRAFILPAYNEIEDAGYRSAEISLQKQGIYVYRQSRLIEGPTWLGVGASETHINNLRVELSVEPACDPIIGLGIKKSGLHINEKLAEELAKVLAPIRREADARSRGRSAAKAVAANSADGRRPADRTIEDQGPNLRMPKVTKSADGSVSMTNNRDDGIEVLGPGGQPNPRFQITVNDSADGVRVVHVPDLQDRVLWAPSLGRENAVTQVSINTSHDWYQRAYLPNSANAPLVEAIEYLLFALAQAEMNNTDFDLGDVFEEFRVEVSRNLRKLVADLPEPDLDIDA